MKTRRKRRYSVTANQPDSADEAAINEEPAQNVLPVVGNTSVEESATEDGSDNADAGLSVLQVATNNGLYINLFSYNSLIL